MSLPQPGRELLTLSSWLRGPSPWLSAQQAHSWASPDLSRNRQKKKASRWGGSHPCQASLWASTPLYPPIPPRIHPGLQLPLFSSSLFSFPPLPSSSLSSPLPLSSPPPPLLFFLWLSTFKNMVTTSIAYFLSHKLLMTKLGAESPQLRDCPPAPSSAHNLGVQAQHTQQCLILGLLPTPSRDHGKGQAICTQTRGKPSKGMAITKEDVPWYGLSVHTTEGTDALKALPPGWRNTPPLTSPLGMVCCP